MNFSMLGRSLYSAVVFSLLPLAAGAQQNAPDTPQAAEPIDTVTIIGRSADTADVPGSAHIVSSEELSVFLQSDILRALRAVPGVYVQEEEGFGLRPNIGIRGSGLDRSSRIALLEDGVLIAPAPYSAPSAYYFPTQRRMNALEVLKGPASIAIGPRTTGGAINMISTPIPNAFSANIDVRGGSFNTADAHMNVGNRGERVSWLLETVQARSDGFKTIDGPVGGSTGFDIEDYIAKLRLDSDPSNPVYQSLRLKLGHTDHVSSETYLGLTNEDFAADPNRRYAASAIDEFVSEHEQYQATYVIDTGSFWRGEVTAYRNDFARNWYKLQSVGGENLNAVLTDPTVFSTEYGYLTGTSSPDDALQIRANNRSYFSKGVQATIEWDLGVGDTDVQLNTGLRVHEDAEDRFQHQDGYRIQDGSLLLTTAATAGSQTNRVSSASALSLFVDSEIRTGSWIVTPGVRFEDIDMRRLDYATDDPGRVQGPTRTRETSVQVVIPGIGVLYKLNNEWRVLAGVHKGFNPPAPGSTAQEESSINIEVGTRFDGDSLSFESIYFVNGYDNLVGTVTDSTGGGGMIGDQFDGGEVIVQGLELNAAYGIAAGGVDIPLSMNYTWTSEAEFKNAFDSGFGPWGRVEVGDELPYIPQHQFRVTAGIVSERFRADVAANYVAEMRTQAGQGAIDPATAIPSHVVWDLTATWSFTANLSTYLKLDNLFDETYVAARRPSGARPGLPRTTYLGLTYRL